MLTPDQIKMVKMAQREAGLSDGEYREALALFGAHSSKDAHLTDEHWDKLLAYFEAIFWRKYDATEGSLLVRKVFRQRDYWKNKNFAGATSRDRFTLSELGAAITALESALSELGCNTRYLTAIRQKVTRGITTARTLMQYQRALERTLAARRARSLEVAP